MSPRATGTDDVLRRARTQLGPVAVPDDLPTAEALARVLESVLERLDAGDGPEGALLTLGADAQDALSASNAAALVRREHLVAQVQAAHARLGRISSSTELVELVCAEAIRSCGLRRVMLSYVDGDTWVPWKARFDGATASEHAFLARTKHRPIPLAHSAPEAEVVSGARPRIVDQTPSPILRELNITGAYVVAPIAPAGRVVGLLHADHHPDDLDVDVRDRDVLWGFAEGFGRIYERLEIHERLRGQRQQARDALAVVDSIATAIEWPELTLFPSVEPVELEHDPLLSLPERPDLEDVLTARERDVFVLMLRGLTNKAIAERLIVQPSTVKDHVKKILRKLGAANRAEVIGLFHDYDPTSQGQRPRHPR